MTVNRTCLITQLCNLLNTSYLLGSTAVEDVLSTALSTCVWDSVNLLTVSTVDELPNLKYYNSPSGMIYFVTNTGVFAASSGDRWLTLDGRLLRQDSFTGLTFSWGCNTSGQLGDNTSVSTSSPVIISGALSDWCRVSAGDCHNLAMRPNGSVWAWGYNTRGAVGDNTATIRSSPVSVVGGFSDWCQISAGNAHSLGLRTSGSAWAWGNNTNGRLGDNTATSRSSPVSVVGGFSDWCQISGGGGHSLGLRTSGSAWAWGCNNFGQLGDNTTTSKSSPVSVVGGFSNWCQLRAGSTHNLALRTDGTAWAWGLNSNGPLGDNTATSRLSPVSVVGGFSDWCQLSAGNGLSLGVRTSGSAWAWGVNSSGSLGDNTTTNKSSPVSVVGGFANWCQVSAGANHSLGVRTNGSAWSWGNNSQGRLGDNTTTNASSPVSVVGGFSDWSLLSTGAAHSLGLRIRC
jgi:alpha-tubulin suppressor-like RCC1 family protein